MLKIFKKIDKKIREKILDIAYKYSKDLTEITNRPLEGEIVRISNIKIPKNFQIPRIEKLNRRYEHYKRHNYFRSTIILDNKNNLLDGYTTYILAKEMNFDYITILREN